MRIGMIGLGRMGASMVRRLLQGGHECVAYDPQAEGGVGGGGGASAGGGGGGGGAAAWRGRGRAPLARGGRPPPPRGGSPAPGPAGGRAASAAAAALGYLHCGAHGAGHFVKMVHNGIEYGLMAAYAEGLNILAHADAGLRTAAADAETAPLANPRFFQYRLDLAAIAGLLRHGSVIASPLLDLTAAALAQDGELAGFGGHRGGPGGGGRGRGGAGGTRGAAPRAGAGQYCRS